MKIADYGEEYFTESEGDSSESDGEEENLQFRHEPEWGHNSGSSEDNGPTDHFYHGKASPYSVTGQD